MYTLEVLEESFEVVFCLLVVLVAEDSEVLVRDEIQVLEAYLADGVGSCLEIPAIRGLEDVLPLLELRCVLEPGFLQSGRQSVYL